MRHSGFDSLRQVPVTRALWGVQVLEEVAVDCDFADAAERKRKRLKHDDAAIVEIDEHAAAGDGFHAMRTGVIPAEFGTRRSRRHRCARKPQIVLGR